MKETTLRTSKNVSFDGISNVEAGYHRRQRKSIVVSLVLLAIALVLAAVMMLYGNTIYTPSEVWDALKEVEGSAVFTVKTLRLPRMLTAILAGFAFGMAGNTFQQLLGNPLASPDIITSCSDIRSFGILSDLCFVSGRRIFQCEADFNWNWYAGIFKCDYFMALIKGIRV